MSELIYLPVALLHPHPGNPRKQVGDVSELAQSITAQGIQQNLLVTQEPGSDTDYRVVIGHRRLAAAKLAGLTTVPCVIAELSEREQMELMIVENSQRSDLKPIEEADAYQGLLDLGMTQTDIAARTGRSRSYVGSRLKVAAIPQDARAKATDFNQLSLTDLEALAEFNGDSEAQEKLMESAGTGNWDWELNHARKRQHAKQWMTEALDWINLNHLAMLPDSVKLPEYTWRDPQGYQREHCYRPSLPESFAEQYRSANTAGQLLAVRDDAVYAYTSITDRKPSAYELEDKRRQAERRVREKPVKEFADTSRTLRLAWLHANHTRIGTPRTDVIMALASEQLLGYSTWALGTSMGADFEDRMLDAYNTLSHKPLPVTQKDTKNHVYHLATEQNITALKERSARDRRGELLLLLIATREAHIDYTTWMSDDLTPLTDYYEHLHALGYPISDEEQAALNGKYQEEES